LTTAAVSKTQLDFDASAPTHVWLIANTSIAHVQLRLIAVRVVTRGGSHAPSCYLEFELDFDTAAHNRAQMQLQFTHL